MVIVPVQEITSMTTPGGAIVPMSFLDLAHEASVVSQVELVGVSVVAGFIEAEVHPQVGPEDLSADEDTPDD